MLIILLKTKFIWSITILLMLLEFGTSIKLLNLAVPKSIPVGSRASLSCKWQLDSTDILYSVKWYMNGREFYRYVPRDIEPRRKFLLPGVNVESSDPSGSSLILSPVTLETGGRYRCEISGEGPLFATVSDHADMAVVVLPEYGPIVTGFCPKYRIGDRVMINCTSGHSQPATRLSWYINGEPISTEEYTSTYRSENALIVTSLNLNFEVTENHFWKNVLKVKCLATIAPIYWKSNEETAIQEKIRVHHDIGTSISTTSINQVQTNCVAANFLTYSCISFAFLIVLDFINISGL